MIYFNITKYFKNIQTTYTSINILKYYFSNTKTLK